MRYAILGDIHSNLEAIFAVLEDLNKNKVEKIFSVGDIIGYGAEPSRCLAIARERFEFTTAGNHDWAVVGKLDLNWFNELARKAIVWTQELLSEEELKILAGLSLVEEYQNMIFVHGSLFEPMQFHYLLNLSQARKNFDSQDDKKLCFIGHSHIPFFVVADDVSGEIYIQQGRELRIEPRKRYLVNVGSVGQPRDGDPRACYVLYDSDKNLLELRRVEYDVEEACTKIISLGLPYQFGERLYYGR